MTTIFKVIKREGSTQYAFIEAESSDKAIEYASSLDGEAWRENQDYDNDIEDPALPATPEELHGCIVERTDGTYFNYEKAETEQPDHGVVTVENSAQLLHQYEQEQPLNPAGQAAAWQVVLSACKQAGMKGIHDVAIKDVVAFIKGLHPTEQDENDIRPPVPAELIGKFDAEYNHYPFSATLTDKYGEQTICAINKRNTAADFQEAVREAILEELGDDVHEIKRITYGEMSRHNYGCEVIVDYIEEEGEEITETRAFIIVPTSIY